jgi:hypothetical protein
MKSIIKLILVAAAVAPALSYGYTDPKSKFGKFKHKFGTETCSITFEHDQIGAKKVFDTDACTLDNPGDQINLPSTFGGVRPASTDACGNEVYIFSSPANREDGADLVNYWVAFINARRVSVTALDHIPAVESVKYRQDAAKNCTVSLYVPTESDALRTELSRRFDIKPSAPAELVVEIGKPPKVLRRDTVTINGTYNRFGTRQTNFMPFVQQGDGEPYVITETSACMDADIADNSSVTARFEVKVLDNGVTRKSCTALSTRRRTSTSGR